MLVLAQIKLIEVLLPCCGSGDTKYHQKQCKFTTFEALFELYGCFVYITMLQIFRNLMDNVFVTYKKLIKAVDLRL